MSKAKLSRSVTVCSDVYNQQVRDLSVVLTSPFLNKTLNTRMSKVNEELDLEAMVWTYFWNDYEAN